MTERIRKQVYEMTEDDLRRFPLWEYALDEEGEEDQDEATVRPVECAEIPTGEPRMGVYAATAKLPDGREFAATLAYYVSHNGVDVDQEGVLYPSQPCILAGGQLHGFWNGSLKPKRSEMDRFYAAVGCTASEVFPIQITARIKVEGEATARQITVTGFQYLVDLKTEAVGETV